MSSKEVAQNNKDKKRKEFLEGLPIIALEIGGQSGPELLEQLKLKGIKTSPNVDFILKSPEFIHHQIPQEQTFGLVPVSKLLGNEEGGTTDEINSALDQLGLSMCPREAGVELMLQIPNAAKGVWITVLTPSTQDQFGADCFLVVSEKEGIKSSAEYPPDLDENYNIIPWSGSTQVLVRLS